MKISAEGPVRDAPARTEDEPLADALAQHHRGLESALHAIGDAVVMAAPGHDPLELQTAWQALERELLRHMEIEEEDFLPAFERGHADEARGLRSEHDAIREQLFVLGTAISRQQLRAEAIAALAVRLRAHSDREDGQLHPWIVRHIPHDRWMTLGYAPAPADARAGGARYRS